VQVDLEVIEDPGHVFADELEDDSWALHISVQDRCDQISQLDGHIHMSTWGSRS
jgi:hypothetical protein